MATIEQEIKQTTFRDAYQRLAINLIYTGNWILHQQLEMLRKHDLSPQQFNVLRILRGSYPEPMMLSSILERMLDRTSNTSRLVDKLLAKNLLERKECLSNRRAVDVRITRPGLDMLALLDPKMEEWEKNLHVLTAQEATQLSTMLDTLRASDE